MRRSLMPALPGLAYHFHLTPDDLDRMNQAEVQTFLDALEDIARRK